MKNDKNSHCSALYLIVFSLITLFATPLQAGCKPSELKKFKIPSQPLKDALLQFSAKCDLTLVVRFSEIENLVSYPIDGKYIVEDVLQILLIDTQLTASLSNKGVIKIKNLTHKNNAKKNTKLTSSKQEVTEVTVTGLRRAQESSSEYKRLSDVIGDVVTEQDVVKMPDKGVAESLQRVSGVTILKRLGEGTKANVRGFSDNLTLLNGETFLTGMEYFQLGRTSQNYEGSLEAIPVDMLNRINVYKSFKASDIEGSIGGTVDLLGRDPFDIKDTLAAAETGVDLGHYSKESQPYSIVTLGKNWNDQFAAAMTYSTSKRTAQVDSAESYLNIANPYIYEAPPIDYNPDILAYIVPYLTKTNDIEQTRDRDSTNLSIGYRPSERVELNLNIVTLNSQLLRRDYEIWNNLSFITENDEITLNTRRPLSFIQSASYEQTPELFSTTVESIETNANNIAIELNWALNDNLRMHNVFTYSNADYDEEYGDSGFFYAHPLFTNSEFNILPVWVGETFVDPDTDALTQAETGWIDYSLSCATCKDTPPRKVTYDVGSFSLARYSDNAFLNNPANAVSSYARATSVDVMQSTSTIKGDVIWQPDASNYTISFGWRFADRHLEQKKYLYLTNLAETEGAANVTQFDENGNVLTPSNYDPLRPADAYNVGVKDAYYSDLCNNGGIAAGKSCDIDGDGEDDNLPYGPWTAEINATDVPISFLRTTSNGEQTYAALLYNNPLNQQEPSKYAAFPGFNPWQSYQQNPTIYKRISNYLPSQDSSMSVYFVDPKPMQRNIGRWIDDRSPYSPTQKFSSPRSSFSVDQKITSLHSELDFESDNWPLKINAGLRLVRTETAVHTYDFNDEDNIPEISLTTMIFPGSGLGSGWFMTTEESQYLDLLPSANLIWDFDESNKLRISAGKTITRHDLQLRGQNLQPIFRPNSVPTDGGTNTPAITPNNGRFVTVDVNGTLGSPDLEPKNVIQADVSFEHYYGLSNYAQVAFFTKKIDGETIQSIVEIDNETIDPSTIPETLPLNVKQSYVMGLEVALQNTWNSGFGVNCNYTYVDSKSNLKTYSKTDYGIPGVSRHTLNLASFYETDTFSIRLVTNWRSEYVDPYNPYTEAIDLTASEGFLNTYLAHTYLPYLQADARITWYPTEKIRFTFDVLNLNQNPSQSYLEYKANISSNLAVETRYIVGIKVSL
jgi:iron complex outermembrane recepter protein